MILDLAVIGILFFSALVAFWRGFVREVLTIFSLIGAAGATFLWGPKMVPVARGWIVDPTARQPQMLFDLIPYDMVAIALGFGLVFMVTLTILTIAAHLFSRMVHYVGLGPVDRSMGVVFGLIRGVVIVALLAVVLNFLVSEDKRTQYFGDSKTYPYVTYLADLATAMMPGKDVISKDRLKAELQGKGPLEPGQEARARAATTKAPAAGKQETDLAPQTNLPRRFND